MEISVSLFNTALDSVFNASATTYEVTLLFSGATSSTPETIDFTASSGGVVQLSSSVFFAVASGTTVIGLEVANDIGTVLIEETVPSETFASNGTFTINDIIVTLTD